jgi:trans-2-enoyl-CoA reductase
LRVLLSPINPADINVLQGVYPAKPTASILPGLSGDIFVAGNEGLAEVSALGSGTGEHDLAVGDWVIIAKPQSGTWASARNLHARDVIKVPRKAGVTEVHAATMTVRYAVSINSDKHGKYPVGESANCIQHA